MTEPAEETIDTFKDAEKADERKTKKKTHVRVIRKDRWIRRSDKVVKIDRCKPKTWIRDESHAKRGCSHSLEVGIVLGTLFLLSADMSSRVVSSSPSGADGAPFKLPALLDLLKNWFSVDMFEGGSGGSRRSRFPGRLLLRAIG